MSWRQGGIEGGVRGIRAVETLWIAGARLVTPEGLVAGALGMAGGRVVAIRARAPRAARVIAARGAYVAPGFIDLHVWGDPAVVSQAMPAGGATAFLTAVGPASRERLVEEVATRARAIRGRLSGARCLGIHLEGPFVSRRLAGALSRRYLRAPAVAELRRLARAAQGMLRLVTMAPELPGAAAAVRWCARRRMVVSLGHSEADAAEAVAAIQAGAAAVTHVFNAMPSLHHRAPSLVDVALGDPRLTAMVIADGVHVSLTALRVLVAAKGSARVALVTDSIRYAGWRVRARNGAYYTAGGRLAGSALTMMGAVRHSVLAGVPIAEAVRMASETPARLLGLRDRSGRLTEGAPADLVVFDEQFRVRMTIVRGQVVYER